MKKIILAVLVLGGLWLGGTYVIGQTVEDRLREQVAELELIPGSNLVRLELSDYDAGVLGAQARTCLVFHRLPPDLAGLMAFSGKLCQHSDIHYGPLLFTDEGPALGLAYVRARLDQSALPEPVTAMIDEVFGGQPPVIARTLYRFDGGLRVHAAVTPFQVASPAGRFSLGRLALRANTTGEDASAGRFFITGRDLRVAGPVLQASLPALDVDINVKEMLDGLLPLADMTLAATGLNIASGGRDQVAGDLTLRTRSRLDGDTLAGDLGLWFEGLAGDMLPPAVDSGYLGGTYQGIDSEAAVRARQLLQELDRLRIEIMVAVLGDDQVSLEAYVAEVRRLEGELRTVLVEDLLLPNRSGVTLMATLDGEGGRSLTLDSRLDYLGLDGLNANQAKLGRVRVMDVLQTVDLDLSLDADPTLLPQRLRARLAEPMEAGWLQQRDGRLVSRLVVRDGDLLANGESMLPADLSATP